MSDPQGIAAGSGVSLVVGASRGIGLALVEAQLADASVRRTIATHRPGSDRAGLDRLAERYGERLQCVELDVTDEASVAAFATFLRGMDGGVDLAIPAAGLLHDARCGRWQSGLLGDFYQPTNSSLINTGSLTSAASGGLYHYATTTNQVKESNSTLDIGYQYVALSNGLPVDTDGDSQADYFEDTNGNGLFETTTDFGDWTNYLYAITTFAGVSFNQDQWPGRPDTMGAIGSDHFMEVINGAVAIYARSNGLQVAYTNLDDVLRVTVTNLPFAGTYPQR